MSEKMLLMVVFSADWMTRYTNRMKAKVKISDKTLKSKVIKGSIVVKN